MKTSQFIFAVCQVGAEPALKQEVTRAHPDLRFAYSRPGFVTFRSEKEKVLAPGFRLNSVLARAYGISFGQIGGKTGAKTEEKALTAQQRAESILAWGREFAQEASGTTGRKAALRLHVWERDRFPSGEEPLNFSYETWKNSTSTLIRRIAEEQKVLFPTPVFSPEEAPAVGDFVLNVIGIEENEWWLGLHIHSEAHSPFAGGRPGLVLPAEAPSRAYLKLEEVLLWSGAELKPGDVALEVGSAPGGACYSLLKRGLSVIGVDPGAMDPVVRAYTKPIIPLGSSSKVLRGLPKNWFRHYQIGIADLMIEDLPVPVDWVLLDMNVVPNISLAAVERVITHPRVQKRLLGVLLTVKMNRWILVQDIPQMIERVRAMGLTDVRAAQLSSHKQEIAIYGFTEQGKARRRHGNC
ncbi:MAG: hypothetical protein A2Z97_16430 [Bdellovibrionales bacterium GWB1_52_6]|nr:MAG: hypothetical protein A2Z97_16430 [Bdellovibrionales bacterium GWB1_52_6]